MRFRLRRPLAIACCRRPDPAGGLAVSAFALAVVLAPPGRADLGQTNFQVFGGRMTDNEWGELFDNWGAVRMRDAYQVGAGVQREWPVGRLGFAGVEGQLTAHFGEQTHLELTTPVFIRTPRPGSPFLPSLAYGLGLSLASEPPEVEIDRTGESTELLAHWFFELEFGSNDTAWRPYLRLHHRSHAWETFGARTGSNALFLGVRFPR